MDERWEVLQYRNEGSPSFGRLVVVAETGSVVALGRVWRLLAAGTREACEAAMRLLEGK